MLLRTLALAACLAAPCLPQAMAEGVRVTYSFSDTPDAACEIQLTGDSVRVMKDAPFSPRSIVRGGHDSLQLGKRALTVAEKDSAVKLLDLARRWKGYKRYSCDTRDGYGFSLWTDSLLLNCTNCFSCTNGIGMGEARVLEKLGRYTLWLYQMKQEWPQ